MEIYYYNQLYLVNNELKFYKLNNFVFCLLDIKSFDKVDVVGSDMRYKIVINIGGIEHTFSFYLERERNSTYDFIYDFFKNLTIAEIKEINSIRFGEYNRKIDV